jgi:CDP-diacylglycerol--glycerol-3-phosphate 3-phosphatidyltransferase
MSVVSASFRARVRSKIETPVARFFGRLGFTPNALTLIGFGIAVVAAWIATKQWWLGAGVLMAFGALFDLFDGALARATGKVSKFGAFMDSTFDRAGEAVVYIGIAIGLALVTDQAPVVLGVAVAITAMASAFMVSYTRAKSESLGFSPGSGMANVGIAPREVRTVILTMGLIGAGLVPTGDYPAGLAPAANYGWMVIVGALGLIAILATITTIQRILFVYRQSKSTDQEVTK